MWLRRCNAPIGVAQVDVAITIRARVSYKGPERRVHVSVARQGYTKPSGSSLRSGDRADESLEPALAGQAPMPYFFIPLLLRSALGHCFHAVVSLPCRLSRLRG